MRTAKNHLLIARLPVPYFITNKLPRQGCGSFRGCYFCLLLVYRISAPNGISASFACLKHCRPNGIPIIVMQNSTPFIAKHTAKGIPLIIIHSIFAISDGAPPPYTTSFPKGANDSDANLKHCSPIGIPIIVMHHNNPARHQASACQIPPHIIQMKLPKHPI